MLYGQCSLKLDVLLDKKNIILTMRRYLFSFILTVIFCVSVTAQKKYSVYGIGFYNQENLFDYTHDEGKKDMDFTPDGSYKWNKMKYESKLHNMSKVLSEMGTDVLPNIGCAIIGLAEVENEHVLKDLTAQPSLAARNYKYIHIEGPDQRGIDCALLYNPKLFTIRNVKLVPMAHNNS